MNCTLPACPKLKGLFQELLARLKEHLKYKPSFHSSKARQKKMIFHSLPVIALGLNINLVNEIQSAEKHR